MISLLLFRGGGQDRGAHSGNVRLWLIELYEREAREREEKKRREEEQRLAESRTRQPGLPPAKAPTPRLRSRARLLEPESRAEAPPPVPAPRLEPIARLLQRQELAAQVRRELASALRVQPVKIVNYAAEYAAARLKEEQEEEEVVLLTLAMADL